ncbi:hypothetical protein KBB89_02800 [Candidatus Gracilibacteria bacterium]|nr:hypothetical protein [Candidatus Gracilibacteria bacterium]
MKSPLIIGVSALALLTLSATLFAQTATGSSLITQMKAATHSFTLSGDLNSGATDLESSPLVGKKTGDMLSAGEYNRLLELVGQGGGGGSNTTILNPAVTLVNIDGLGEGTVSLTDKIPACATHVILGSRVGQLVGSAQRQNDSEARMYINNNLVGHAYLGATQHSDYDYDVSEGIFALPSDKVISWRVEAGGEYVSINKYIFLKGYLCGGGGATGGGGGSGWADEPLTGTGNFDRNAQYRFFLKAKDPTYVPQNYTYYADLVTDTSINIGTVCGNIAIYSGTKNTFAQFDWNQSGCGAITPTRYAIEKIQKLGM